MAEQSYLVQGPDGKMKTVRAQSINGAKTRYLATARGVAKGDRFSIKLRGSSDEWTHYTVL